MAFPTSAISPQLLPGEYERLVQLLTVHYGYPLPYPLSGAYFEELFAAAVGGKREERKLLFDVLRQNIGWSLKTLLWPNLQTGTQIDVVVQRCDILRNREVTLDLPPPTLGRHILDLFNGFCVASAHDQGVSDPRAGFLVRNRSERDFVFFQQRYRLYTPDEVEWAWANDGQRSLLGTVNGQLVLRWYRSGTQLFGVYRIPVDHHSFRIDWRRAGLEETIDFFLRAGIAHSEKTD